MKILAFLLLTITTAFGQTHLAAVSLKEQTINGQTVLVIDSVHRSYIPEVVEGTPGTTYTWTLQDDVARYFHAPEGKKIKATVTFTEEVVTPPPATVVKLDDRVATYVGTWQQPTIAGNYNNTISWSCTVGSSFTYNFEGVGIRWIVEMKMTHGRARVEIDGVFMEEVNTFTSGTLPQQMVFEKLGLENKAHVFKVTVLSSCIVNDAFEVLK
jgi:hypothetical protein